MAAILSRERWVKGEILRNEHVLPHLYPSLAAIMATTISLFPIHQLFWWRNRRLPCPVVRRWRPYGRSWRTHVIPTGNSQSSLNRWSSSSPWFWAQSEKEETSHEPQHVSIHWTLEYMFKKVCLRWRRNNQSFPYYCPFVQWFPSQWPSDTERISMSWLQHDTHKLKYIPKIVQTICVCYVLLWLGAVWFYRYSYPPGILYWDWIASLPVKQLWKIRVKVVYKSTRTTNQNKLLFRV